MKNLFVNYENYHQQLREKYFLHLFHWLNNDLLHLDDDKSFLFIFTNNNLFPLLRSYFERFSILRFFMIFLLKCYYIFTYSFGIFPTHTVTYTRFHFVDKRQTIQKRKKSILFTCRHTSREIYCCKHISWFESRSRNKKKSKKNKYHNAIMRIYSVIIIILLPTAPQGNRLMNADNGMMWWDERMSKRKIQ